MTKFLSSMVFLKLPLHLAIISRLQDARHTVAFRHLSHIPRLEFLHFQDLQATFKTSGTRHELFSKAWTLWHSTMRKCQFWIHSQLNRPQKCAWKCRGDCVRCQSRTFCFRLAETEAPVDHQVSLSRTITATRDDDNDKITSCCSTACLFDTY